MGTITLIRHGQASFGKANYDQLSDLGYEQGRELGRWLTHCQNKLDHIVTGSLRRHEQTAQACCETLPADLQPDGEWESDPGFAEYDHVQMLHRYEPRFGDPIFVKALFMDNPNPQQAFQAIFSAAFARWMSGEHDADYSEPWPAFQKRCVKALQRLTQRPGRSQHIAVFTSGGAISAVTQNLLGLPDAGMAELNSSIINASLSKVLFKPEQISLSSLNSHAHFERDGLRHLITYR
ncbi:MAG: histidine phosphatase family protein [Oceanococcus sp.]